ncbi:WD40 repeat domain-containing protein [Phytomonospora endophytica]|uniref:WD40 repeat protein n=1 Tax=Phytomonospora endophytica TaxID=714109 RepID=A0A841FKU1_9ACTN|nr:hypothetical protein [Phytomonospora endophytica]MBB6033259.1 WD40 repeat protein [Phytomonospora endophytica]GIG65485.1 hypothetical protein Pen01_17800 [Phytomonospora endophytica]
MTTFHPFRESRLPSRGGIDDFDLVHHDGRLLAVCADAGGAVHTWDPAADEWRHHPLDMPFRSGDGMDFTEIDAIAAVVADGRIVVGGGAQHQPFALWDLETGAVRSHARLGHAGVGRARGGALGGRPVLLAGDSSAPPRLRVWDADGGDAAEPPEFLGGFDGTGDVAVAELGGVPVVVWGQWDGTVSVWDVEKGECVRNFAEPDIAVHGVGVATVDGAERVVAAGHDVVLLGDPATGVWSSPAEEDEEADDFDETGIRCMDTGAVAGRPIAVTGTAGGRVRMWDLTELRPVAEADAHERDVHAVRVTVLDGRTVAVTGGRDGFLRLWDLDSVAYR